MSGKECDRLCNMAFQVLQFSADRLAQLMNDHRGLIDRLNEAVNHVLSLALPERSEVMQEVYDSIKALRDMREGIQGAAKDYARVVDCCLVRDEYLEALLNYYLYAGSKVEREALSRARALTPVTEELSDVDRTVEEVRDTLVLVAARSASAGGQPSHGSSSSH